MGQGQGRSRYSPKSAQRYPYSLFIREAREVAPVGGEVLELEGVHCNEHEHRIGHHEPPEDAEQLPPQGVVDLRVVAGEQGR